MGGFLSGKKILFITTQFYGYEKAILLLPPYEKWKDEDKNRMGNDVSSEIKIANAGGQMEGGDNKQWHMDQGNFEDHEKQSFENKGKEDLETKGGA